MRKNQRINRAPRAAHDPSSRRRTRQATPAASVAAGPWITRNLPGHVRAVEAVLLDDSRNLDLVLEATR